MPAIAWASSTTTSPSTPRPRKIYGVEWDVTALPTDWLTLNASGSYIDPRYTDFTFIAAAGLSAAGQRHQPVGHAHPGAGLADQRDRDGQFRHRSGRAAAGRYACSRRITTGRAAIWPTCAPINPLQRTFAYGLLNFRLEFTDVGHTNADLALFMNNVANTQACLPEYNGVLNSAPNGTFGIAEHLRRAAVHPAGAAHDRRDAGV